MSRRDSICWPEVTHASKRISYLIWFKLLIVNVRYNILHKLNEDVIHTFMDPFVAKNAAMLCYELEGINQCNWVCKCRIKAEFKLFSAQHFFENSILFIFSNKQLFLFTTFHVHQFSSGWFLPFSQFTVLADQSDPDPQARLLCHSPGSAWHWGGHTRPHPGHLVLRPPQPGPGLQIPVRGPRQYREDTRTDLTSPRAITGRARWTGLKIPWRLHFIGLLLMLRERSSLRRWRSWVMFLLIWAQGY